MYGKLQVVLSAAAIAAFFHFKYFCSNWLVSEYFSAFNLSSLKLCFSALSFSISVSHPSPIFITSHFCLPESDTTCQVFQSFLLYHCPWHHSALCCVLLSVTEYSNGPRSLG